MWCCVCLYALFSFALRLGWVGSGSSDSQAKNSDLVGGLHRESANRRLLRRITGLGVVDLGCFSLALSFGVGRRRILEQVEQVDSHAVYEAPYAT
jgi:hypothetical protein